MRKTNASTTEKAAAAPTVKPLPPVRIVPTEKLVPYDRNPRFNDEGVEAVANSLKTFGWKQPIVIGPDFVVVAGHTRLKAAKKLGLAEVPCVLADDLTEEQLRAYRLVDNKTNELSVWDDLALDEELDALPDFDFKAFGFNYGADLSQELEDSLDDSDLPDVDIAVLGRVVFRFSKEDADAIQGYIKVNGDKVFRDFIFETVGIKPENDVGGKDARQAEKSGCKKRKRAEEADEEPGA